VTLETGDELNKPALALSSGDGRLSTVVSAELEVVVVLEDAELLCKRRSGERVARKGRREGRGGVTKGVSTRGRGGEKGRWTHPR
jgi:uncharacterized membrane protein YgcG